MSTLISNLNYIESCKLDIKSAIEAKGVDMTGVSFPDYATAIENIPAGGSITEFDVTEGDVYIVNLSNSASFVTSYAFYGNSYIQTVDLPNCISVLSSPFRFCYNISEVSLPVCNMVGSYAFDGCSALTELELPMCTYIYSVAFRNCTSLSIVSLNACVSIGTYAFSGCTSLSTIILECPFYCTASRYFLMNTPFELGYGSIFVPSSMVDRYKVSDYWSDYSDRIFPIGYVPPTPTPELSFSDGLLYGSAVNIDDNYIHTYNLGITPLDVVSVSLPDCTFVDRATFQSHYNLASVYMPSLTYVSISGFRHCSALQSIDLPVCTGIDSSAFIGCDLRSISAPNLISTGSWAFGNNYNLSYVDLPAFEGTSVSGTFNGCSSLSAVSLPALKDIGMRMFDSCNLYSITLPAASQIRISAFNNNSNLSEIYLPGSYVCGLGNINALNGTPIASGTGSIYVPWSLVDTYKSRINWSVFASQIYPIGGYPELSFSNGLLYGSCTAFDAASISALGISSADIVSINLPNFSGIQNPIPKFNHCENLLTVSLPAAEQIHFNMFDDCYSLYRVYIPMCGEIGGFLNCSSLSVMSSLYNASLIVSNAFRGGGLTTITLETDSVVTLMSIDAFYNTPIWSGTGSIYVPYSLLEDYKSALAWSYYSSQIFAYDPPVEDLFFDGETGLVYGTASFIDSTYLDVLGITAEQVSAVSLPNCEFVGSSTFKAHPNLVSVSLPACTEVFTQGFSGCSQLQDVYLPNCSTLNPQAFFSCNALNNINLDNCEAVWTGAFRYCYNLPTLSLPKATDLYLNCFANCSNLYSLYLTGSSVVTLSSSAVFLSAPTMVYVPSSMYEGYLTAPVWSTITSRLVPIE